jgi:hypothetical protein
MGYYKVLISGVKWHTENGVDKHKCMYRAEDRWRFVYESDTVVLTQTGSINMRRMFTYKNDHIAV